jgi:hypothetical protein
MTTSPPLAEQHDEKAQDRRYLGLDALARSQALGSVIVAQVRVREAADLGD